MPIRIKPFIVETIQRFVPDFCYVAGEKKGYWFRNVSHPPYFEFIVIGSSQKEQNLRCDVAWGFFPTWNGAYGSHQMTASLGLPNLRLASKAIPVHEGYYAHDGTEHGIRLALDRIGSEVTTFALPWYQQRAREASADRLLQHGLDWLHVHLASIPDTIQTDLQRAFDQACHMPWRVELPVFDALKADLRDFAAQIGASSKNRKETAILAQHLLIYAAEGRNAA